MGSETYEAMQARLQKAFNLVALAADWKGPIDTFVPAPCLKASGLGMADIREAVIHFTATVPVFEPLSNTFESGFWVKAVGYRAGPAGDH